MLQLTNITPFEAERTLLIDRDGNQVWVVIIKATFRIMENGTLKLHDKQETVCTAPVFSGEPGVSSLLRDTEITIDHPGTDISINASAHAPKATPIRRILTSVRVGELSKQILVVGDRIWERRRGWVQPSDEQAFVSLPIKYERAFGGTLAVKTDGEIPLMDPRNPVGCGFCRRAEEAINTPVPNLHNPKHPITVPGTKGEVIGYGTISPGWLPRAPLAGTFDDQWKRNRMPLWPQDYDPRFHLSASPGLIATPALRGGERVELTNLTPSGFLSFLLPRLYFTVITKIANSKVRQSVQLDRVIIEPDEHRLLMVWRSSLNCGINGRQIVKSTVDIKPVVKLA